MCTNPIRFKKIVSKADGKIKYYYSGHSNSLYLNDEYLDKNSQYVFFNCRSCISCRLKHSRDWASRVQFEAKQYDFNYFVTLTYDDENLPRAIDMYPTLNYVDVQKFFKRLRKYFMFHFKQSNIRYFGSGEYGSQFDRPHYHFIIFNLPIPDLKFYKFNKIKQKLYVSDVIQRIWGKGIVVITPLTWQTANYVARYSLKKVNSNIDYGNRNKEFLVMSRRPGIGYQYYHDNKAEIYNIDKVLINTSKKVYWVQPFRYFDKLLSRDDDYLLSVLKNDRQQKYLSLSSSPFDNTDKKPSAYFKTVDENLVQKLKSLKRVL